MSPELVTLLAQIPLVGIFIWYSERLYRQHSTERLQRDTEWRSFLQEERAQRLQAMTTGLAKTEEGHRAVDAMTAAIQDLAEAMQRHDSNADKRNGAVSKALQRLTAVMETHDSRLAQYVDALAEQPQN